MSCSNNRSCNSKSCQRFYNNNTQALAAGQTLQLTIAGSKVVDSGVAIETEPQSFTIVKPGLYRVSADIVFEGSAAGDMILQAYLDGVGLPCTLRTITVDTATNNEVHTETDLSFTSCCCNINHNITFVLTSVGAAAGNVIQSCFGVIKEA